MKLVLLLLGAFLLFFLQKYIYQTYWKKQLTVSIRFQERPVFEGESACLTEIIEKLQANGVVVVGSALENGQDISLIEKTEKMAFIVGNEGNGMNQNILDKCDYIGYIPIQTIESLNVAIAGSILMYHFSN